MYLKLDYLVDVEGRDDVESLTNSLADALIEWANANGVTLTGIIEKEHDDGQEQGSDD